MKGPADLFLFVALEPMQLFRMVATPNGTTEAGWAVMEKRGVPHAISDAIVAASKRAAELAAEVAKAHGEGAWASALTPGPRPRTRRIKPERSNPRHGQK